MALALQNLAKLYKRSTLPLFYLPYYQEFVTREFAAEKVLEGSKIQFAQVFPSFMEHCFLKPEEEQKVQATSCDDLHKLVIDQYKVFFDVDQNKEVMHMAMDNCATIIVKMQEPEKHNLEPSTAAYFDAVFKSHFRLLEKQIHSNWRLHKAYYEAQG